MERPHLLRPEGEDAMSTRLRCAIYTRKSSEEGLDQNFNSLHAQREACEAYILSQTGEGWTGVKTAYDDGGFSGGSMERPGLRQLMADITRGLVDVVVVYKVDRLTRSLADFAKIVELFDSRGVSFVSVTQAFNTTSSMGRLTLNVLLSFAQFEREVTGERIRDKVAASKAKGMRMGGRPPLGYDITDGRLALNPHEAPRVKRLFQRYLEVGSVKDLERDGVESKRWTNKDGKLVGGGPMTRGAIHYLLGNPAYRGATQHKEKRYEATHPSIIGEDLWNAVQAKRARTYSTQPGTKRRGEGAPLQGLVFDDRDNPMSPVHTKRGNKRYRYYISRATLTGAGDPGTLPRISAGVLEQFLNERLSPLIAQRWDPEGAQVDRAVAAIKKVVLSEDRLVVTLASDALSSDASATTVSDDGACEVKLPFHMRRRQGAIVLEPVGAQASAAPKVDRALVRALVLARAWMAQLESGQIASVKEIARRESLCSRYTARFLPLAYLAPSLTELILAGRQPRTLTLRSLTEASLPMDWSKQEAVFAAG